MSLAKGEFGSIGFSGRGGGASGLRPGLRSCLLPLLLSRLNSRLASCGAWALRANFGLLGLGRSTRSTRSGLARKGPVSFGHQTLTSIRSGTSTMSGTAISSGLATVGSASTASLTIGEASEAVSDSAATGVRLGAMTAAGAGATSKCAGFGIWRFCDLKPRLNRISSNSSPEQPTRDIISGTTVKPPPSTLPAGRASVSMRGFQNTRSLIKSASRSTMSTRTTRRPQSL